MFVSLHVNGQDIYLKTDRIAFITVIWEFCLYFPSCFDELPGEGAVQNFLPCFSSADAGRIVSAVYEGLARGVKGVEVTHMFGQNVDDTHSISINFIEVEPEPFLLFMTPSTLS